MSTNHTSPAIERAMDRVERAEYALDDAIREHGIGSPLNAPARALLDRAEAALDTVMGREARY